MECHVCLEDFDAAQHRPKVLPCGHSFCAGCLSRLPARRCPIDSKVFETPTQDLPDNFVVLQAIDAPRDTAARPERFWCLRCHQEAAADCVSEHAVRSLKRARALEAAAIGQRLQTGEAALERLGEVLVAEECASALSTCHRFLQLSRTRLAVVRATLQEVAQGADEADWERSKQAAEEGLPYSVSRCAAQLATDLLDEGATCTLTVQAGGGVAWSGSVRPAGDATARLLLCRVACLGRLQEQRPTARQHHGAREQPLAAQDWVERSNDQEAPAGMVAGARVRRGKDWAAWWPALDDNGPGTVTRAAGMWVDVRWDADGQVAGPYEVRPGLVSLQLLRRALVPDLRTRGELLDVRRLCSSEEVNAMTKMLQDGSLDRVRTLVRLPCESFAPWSLRVLQQVAPRLEGLQMVSPRQEHLEATAAMPHLKALSLIGVHGDQLRQVVQMASLRRLEVHCKLTAPLAVAPVPLASPARLLWLRCGVYPLRAALALVRAHAAALEELQLVAASVEPYGCPDLAAELGRCGVRGLKRLVLLRETAHGALCRHDAESCKAQVRQLWDVLGQAALVLCSECHRAEFDASQKE